MALYRALLAAAFPALLLYLGWRSLRDRRYWRSLGERFGYLPSTVQQTSDGCVWLHAVSVGEVLTSVRLLDTLREALPGVRMYVSVSTLAGRAVADEKLAGAADKVFYAPFDFVFAVRRVLRRMRPRLLIVQETEIWPNLWNEAKRAGAGLIVVNGRISDKAFPKYRAFRWFFGPVLNLPDRILAQGRISLERFVDLGARPERLSEGGNLKFDFQPSSAAPPAAVTAVVQRTRPRQVWVAASTMPPAMPGDPDESEAVAATFLALTATHPELLLIWAPRKPELFDEAAARLTRAGVPFLRRSQLQGTEAVPLPGVLLLDSMGELSSLFPLAGVVFMGGTLASRGGHNILEPAFSGKPVIVGPHMENFAEIDAEFRAGGALIPIAGVEELSAAVARVLDDAAYARTVGERGRRLAESRRGATALAAALSVERFDQSVPRAVNHLVSRIFFGAWAKFWEAGVRLRRARQSEAARSLPKPVVSIGGLGMGGAGKTPMAIWAAEALRAAGNEPACLTRGYKRHSLDRVLVLAPGDQAPPRTTGDEAQLLLQSRLGAVGISGDRLEAGKAVLELFSPDVFILDDGFQHWRLRRDCDVVLLDALDPLSGGAAFPLGRQREPLEALERAHAVVVSRSIRPWPGLERMVRRYTDAPIFHSRFVPRSWRRWTAQGASAESIPACEFQPGKVVAFCGLGNPVSFWSTLAGAGIRPARRWSFGDHHLYRPAEIRRMVTLAGTIGAGALLTTAKDVQNLPPETHALTHAAPVWWLEIDIEVDRPDELAGILQKRMAAGPRVRGSA